MTWNHRVFELTDPQGNPYFELREVYYDELGNITGYTEDAASPLGEDLIELRQDLGRMLLALDKPVLVESDIPTESAPTWVDEVWERAKK